MWRTWTIRPTPNGDALSGDDSDVQMSNVTWKRLTELWLRVDADEGHADGQIHQLVRFNIYNFGELPQTVVALELRNLQGATLTCDLVPSINVAAGARYPMMVEIRGGPVTESAHVAVDVRGGRVWVHAQTLPPS